MQGSRTGCQGCPGSFIYNEGVFSLGIAPTNLSAPHSPMSKVFSFHPDAYSLKTRFALVSVALFLLSVWGMAVYVAYELEHDMEDLLAEQQRAMASSIAQAIGTSVRMRRESLLLTADDITPELLYSKRGLDQLLSEHQGMHQLFDIALIVTTPSGRVLAQFPPRPAPTDSRFTERGLTRAIIETRQFSVGLPAPDKSGKVATIPFGAPIMGKDGEVAGILFGITSLLANDFVDRTADLKSDIGYLVVTRSNRQIVAATDKSRIMHPAPPAGVNPLLDRFISGYNGSGISVDARGIEELSSAQGVRGTDWVVAVSMPTEDAFDPVVQVRKRILASAAILSLAVALLTWLFVQSTLRPLEHLVKSVRTMGTPDFPLRQLSLETSGPEIGKLVEAFNRMQQRIAEQATVLKENAARFYFVADHSPMLIWISDETGRRIWFNRTWLEATSRSPEQAPTVTWIEDIHPDDRSHYLASCERAMAARESFRTKFRLRDAGGAYRWFLEMAVPRFVDDNKLAGYVGSCLDIDEQIAAQSNAETLLRENRTLMAERFTVEEAERRRLARDLHDDLGQWLTAINVNAEAICAISSREGQERIHHCANAIVTSTGAIQDCVRAMNRKLGSDTLATLGLKESLEEFVAGWREQQAAIATELTVGHDLGELENPLATAVLRLTQEAFTNVARHSGANRVSLDLLRLHASGGDELLLSIIDDGVGFDIEGKSRGVGLIGMRERAVALGGVCTVRTAPGLGTAVEIRIPLRQEASVR